MQAANCLIVLASRLRTTAVLCRDSSPRWSACRRWMVDLSWFLSRQGVNDWFLAAYDLFKSLTEGEQYLQDFHDNLKSEISSSQPGHWARNQGRGAHPEDISSRTPEYTTSLRRMSNISSSGMMLAFSLTMFFARYARSLESGHGRLRWRHDCEIDDLLVEFATSIKEESPDFRPVAEFEALYVGNQGLALTNTEPHFPKIYRLPSSICT